MNNSYIQLDLKASNRRMVYDALSRQKMVSRAELSRMLGISGATILKIIDYFVEKKVCFYETTSDDYRNVGRKPVMLRFNPDFSHVLSICVEGEYISMAVVNVAGEILTLQEYRALDVWGFLFSNINPIVHTLLETVRDVHLVGIGVALPAVINPTTYEIIEAPLLKNTDPLNLKRLVAILEQEFQVPVCVQNDVNACAYGEYQSVYSQITDSMLYISAGTGVGCGLILNSKIVQGENNSAGEIGYMIFDEMYQARETGGGWLEKRINMNAVARLLDSQSCQELLPENRTEVVIDYLARVLSLCLVNITSLIDINIVVLGGVIMENYGEPLIRAIREHCAALHYQKRTITLCKTRKPGVVGLSYLAASPMLEHLMEE